MPLIQRYDVEVEIIFKVINTSTSERSTILNITTTARQEANSYDNGKSIPAALTKAIDELHKKAAAHARLARDHETERLK